jgi:hypothetical protein
MIHDTYYTKHTWEKLSHRDARHMLIINHKHNFSGGGGGDRKNPFENVKSNKFEQTIASKYSRNMLECAAG